VSLFDYAIAFLGGHLVGSKAQGRDYGDLARALQDLRDSRELRFVLSALTHHLGHAMNDIGEVLTRGETGGLPGTEDLLELAHILRERRDAALRS
jgi:uncharacterized protein YjiS (DUF1127 family)